MPSECWERDLSRADTVGSGVDGRWMVDDPVPEGIHSPLVLELLIYLVEAEAHRKGLEESALST